MSVRVLFVIVAALIFARASFAQSEYPDVRYDTLRTDPFPGYEYANFIVNWYHTEGYSWSERYSSEIIVVDSLLIVVLSSPGATDYHHVSYLRKRILANSELAQLRRTVQAAKLRQVRVGIPSPTFSGSGQDVLLVRQGRKQLAGGRIFGTVGSDEDTLPEYDGVTIGGNLDTVFNTLSRLFPMHDTLLGLVFAGHQLPDLIGGRPLRSFVMPADSEYLWLAEDDTVIREHTDSAAIADSIHVLQILDRTLSDPESERPLDLAMISYILAERLPSVPPSTGSYLRKIVANDPRYFFEYVANEPGMQFGQIDDWAEIISSDLAYSPDGSDSKAVYDAAEVNFETVILRATTNASIGARTQVDIFIDRLRDIKHNIEERM